VGLVAHTFVRLAVVGLSVHPQLTCFGNFDREVLAAVEPDLTVDGAGAAGLHVHDQQAVDGRGVYLALVPGLLDAVAGARDPRVEVEFAPVVGGVPVPRQQQVQVTQRLVAAYQSLGHELLLHQLLALAVVAGEQQCAGLGKPLLGSFPVARDRAACPQRVDVQLQPFVLEAAEHHGAESAVADGQGLVPVGRRIAVPEGGGLVCLLRLGHQAGDREQQRGRHPGELTGHLRRAIGAFRTAESRLFFVLVRGNLARKECPPTCFPRCGDFCPGTMTRLRKPIFLTMTTRLLPTDSVW
jgi:hypothetical protein